MSKEEIKRIYYKWKNYGQMRFGTDIENFEISASAGGAIWVRFSSGGKQVKLTNGEIEYLFGTLSSNKLLQELSKIKFPKKKKYDKGGCDGFAWELEVDEDKYEGYLIEPKFIEEVKRIFKYGKVKLYIRDRITLQNVDWEDIYRAKEYFDGKKQTDEVKENREGKKMDNHKVQLVPTMKEKIEEDGAWCASFALAWKEFERAVLEDDFVYEGNSEIAKNLIDECKKNITVADKDCYVKSGKMTFKLKKEIKKAIKKKFKTKSDILDMLEFSKDEKNADILVYAIVMFVLEFPNKFDEYDEEFPFGKGDLGNLEKVKYFGIIRDRKTKELKNQVQPLFYNSEKDFALALDSKDGKKIVLYRSDECDNFETAYEKVLTKSNENNQHILLGDVAIPNLKLDLFNIFNIEGRFVKKKDGVPYRVAKAMQSLKFQLNSEGAKVKSEAVMMIEKACFRPDMTTNFYFTDTFYLFIVDSDNPIVAMRVNDIKNFK